MMGSLPGWLSRLSAVALLLAVLAAGYLYVAAPLVAAYRGADEEIRQTRQLIARFEAVAATRRVYRDQWNELSSRQAGGGVYLGAQSDALASAELQGRIRDTVAAHGGTLRSIQSLPAESDGDFLRVAVRVQFTGNLAAMHRILYTLEASRPFVFLDNLDVRSRRARRSKDLEDSDPELTIRFDLAGYLRPESGS